MFLYNHKVLVWLDETGSDRRTFWRKCGYAIRGERAIKHTLLSRGKRINAIIALSSSGIVARYLTEGTVDTNTFIRSELIPNMQPFDGDSIASMVIMDNLSVHHCSPIVSLLQDCGI